MLLSALGGLVLLIVLVVALGSGSKTPTASTTTTPPPAAAQQPAPPQPPASPSPAAPQYTASQQQAIDAATNYLSDGQGFSEAGLIQQLTSSYGNGFSQDDAQFAIAHVNVDWNQQAAMSAKNYMSDGQGFSCSSLLDQLTSQYGGQFTQAQGEYGVQSVGLGSC